MQKIRCSQLDRILACPGSLHLPQIEQESSEYASKGTRIHEEMAEKYKQRIFDTPYLKYIQKGWHTNAIERYYEYENLSGTADFWRYDKNEKLLEIVDLKTGYQEVSPFTNQLKGYALLVIRAEHLRLDKCKLTIFQNDKANSVVLEYADIERFELMLKSAVHSIDISEGAHCQYCPAFLNCPAKINKMESIMDAANTHKFLDKDKMRELLQARSDVNKYHKMLREVYERKWPDDIIRSASGKFMGVK